MTPKLTPYVARLVLQWGEQCPEQTYRRLEGSLAFCDLSGFTAMSEKLASLGRLGAEELTEVLNLLFAALLDDAASYGGGLLKYGGDAVLLFFEGDDHAARAAAATHRMRATLRRIGRVTTSKGIVRVRMSVGIHTGEFDFFLVGESHRELIVTGIGATTTCDMETAADAGEIMLSPATAAALPPSCVGEPKGDGLLLQRAPRTPSRDPSSWGVVPDNDPLPFIPVGLHRHIGEVGTDAEHRHVAVGFIAFGGVDELLGHHGGDHTATVLHDFIASCQAAFDRYEVCFLYADIYGNGGKVFFTAGAPVSHEDNEERLLRAALDINATHYPGLHLHTGLNRGYVFAGDVGATFRRTYTIIGDAVNTAARVMASCDEDGQIRTMPAVLDLATSRFDTAPQTPFAAKGKALPLETFAVGKPLGPRRPDAPLPLIGRTKELEILRQRLARVAQGRGGVAHVNGPAGIGKSRLVDDARAAAEATGFATVTTYAERYEQGTPYYAVRQLLEIIFGDAAKAADTLRKAFADLLPTEMQWAPLVASVMGHREETAITPDAVPSVLGRLLVALLDSFLDGPSLWVLENGHLVDDGSAKVFEGVVEALASRPWLLVVVSRTDEGDGLRGLPGDELELGPLTADASSELARTAHPHLMPTVARMIADRAGGNPMFIRQLVAAASDGAELSDNIEAAVAARIDRLAPRDRDVLRTAAVLGGRFELDALAELIDASVDQSALSDFVGFGDGTGVFRQAVYRDVAYNGLTFKRRRDLHLLAARRLAASSDPPAARLSFHFHNAQSWSNSWRYSNQAANEARHTAAKVVGADLYARAVEAGRHIRDQVSAEELCLAVANHAHCLYLAGRADDADAIVAKGRKLSTHAPVARAQLNAIGTAIREKRGDAAGTLRWSRRGLEELDQAAVDLRSPDAADSAVGLMVSLAKCNLDRGRVAEARALSARALAVAEGEPEFEGRVHTLDMFIALADGDLGAAIAAAELSVVADRQNDLFNGSLAVGLQNLASLQLMAEEWREAESLNRESISLNQLLGNDIQTATSQANLAEVLIEQGQWDEAEMLLHAARPVLDVTYPEGAEFAAQLVSRLHRRRDGVADDPNDPLPEILRAVAARLGAGRELGDDEDAKRLGIVAVPEWAKPVAT